MVTFFTVPLTAKQDSWKHLVAFLHSAMIFFCKFPRSNAPIPFGCRTLFRYLARGTSWRSTRPHDLQIHCTGGRDTEQDQDYNENYEQRKDWRCASSA